MKIVKGDLVSLLRVLTLLKRCLLQNVSQPYMECVAHCIKFRVTDLRSLTVQIDVSFCIMLIYFI